MKEAVISLGVRELLSPLSFKRTLLLFDKIIVEKSTFELTQAIIRLIKRAKGLDDDTYFQNIKLIEILRDKNVLDFRSVNYPVALDFNNYISPEEADELLKRLAEIQKELDIVSRKTHALAQEKSVADILVELGTTFPTNFPRLCSLLLNLHGSDSYPLYTNPHTYSTIGHKQNVIKLILRNLPEPDEATPLENVLEFRRNSSSVSKYMALTKWINEVSKKELSIHELEEEYKYLYDQYCNELRTFQIKNKQGYLEIFVSAALDTIGGTLSAGPITTSLFSVWKHQIKMLEAEFVIKGKEIAYVYKAVSQLGN